MTASETPEASNGSSSDSASVQSHHDDAKQASSVFEAYAERMSRVASYSQFPDEADMKSLGADVPRSQRSRPGSIANNEKQGEEEEVEYDPFLVHFDGTDDQEDMRRLPYFRKLTIGITVSAISLLITVLSSIWSMASDNIMEEYKVGHTTAALGISLYIFGLGFGPMFLSPISEFYGRRVTYVFGLSLSFVFQFMTAFGKNLATILIGRFFSGFCGSAFMAVASGTYSDIFSKEEIQIPLMIYTLSPFVGPSLGPLIGGFIDYHVGWRWLFYVMLIATGVVLAAMMLLVPETYQPVLLQRKAKRLRKERGDDRYYAPLDRIDHSLFDTIILSSRRPFLLLLFDPMMFCLCFYTGFILAIVYMFFVAFPYVFSTVYGFNEWEVGLSFLGLLVGLVAAAFTSPQFQKRYEFLVERNGGVTEPEFRLPQLMVGGFFAPVGLFMFGWTAYSHVHWIVPIIGSVIYGMGTLLAFSGIFTYTVDGYRLYTASAMAANSFVRSTMAGVFPLFGLQMFKGMGVHWAMSLLGFVAIALIPIGFLFYKYGKTLRSKSRYAWSD